MKRYRIVWTGRQMGDGPEVSDPTGPWGYEMDAEAKFTDALVLARLYAEEHAHQLDVEVSEIKYGAEFTTNNGTLVRYEVTAP